VCCNTVSRELTVVGRYIGGDRDDQYSCHPKPFNVNRAGLSSDFVVYKNGEFLEDNVNSHMLEGISKRMGPRLQDLTASHQIFYALIVTREISHRGGKCLIVAAVFACISGLVSVIILYG
jgi:hypothetical protein